MLKPVKKRFKPQYKIYGNLRVNIQNRHKLLGFKKKKWMNIIFHYNRQLKKYNKFKPIDQTRLKVSLIPIKRFSLKFHYKNVLTASKSLRNFYGNLTKQKEMAALKKTRKKDLKYNVIYIKFYEKRLDTILYRAKFCHSIRSAKQVIKHGNVFVNKVQIVSPAYQVPESSIISISNQNFKVIELNLKKSLSWPIPPKTLVINYKTLEIYVTNGSGMHSNFNFNFFLDLEKAVVDRSLQ